MNLRKQLVNLFTHWRVEDPAKLAGRILAINDARTRDDLLALEPDLMDALERGLPCTLSMVSPDYLKQMVVEKLTDTCGLNRFQATAEDGYVLDVTYCNTGDAYATTILWVDGEMKVADWGGVLEDLEHEGYVTG